jgi:hypothetical protein
MGGLLDSRAVVDPNRGVRSPILSKGRGICDVAVGEIPRPERFAEEEQTRRFQGWSQALPSRAQALFCITVSDESHFAHDFGL